MAAGPSTSSPQVKLLRTSRKSGQKNSPSQCTNKIGEHAEGEREEREASERLPHGEANKGRERERATTRTANQSPSARRRHQKAGQEAEAGKRGSEKQTNTYSMVFRPARHQGGSRVAGSRRRQGRGTLTLALVCTHSQRSCRVHVFAMCGTYVGSTPRRVPPSSMLFCTAPWTRVWWSRGSGRIGPREIGAAPRAGPC